MNALSELAAREYPDKPGVYIWRDASGAPIYVGKARSLHHRVRSYFVGEKDIKTRFLMERAGDIEIIVTATEYEALLLENNLIKEWKPKYNIDLKDGKTYPVIRITNEDFPRVFRTRRIVFDGSEYFGPYPKPQQIDAYLKLIERYFPLRRCRGPLKQRAHPCLDFHMGRCSAPCCGRITKEDYGRIIDSVSRLLTGRNDELLRDLKEKMKAASAALEFERAAQLRDQVAAIEEVFEGQRVQDLEGGNRDYVAHVVGADSVVAGGGLSAIPGRGRPEPSMAGGGRLLVVVLQVRDGKLMGKEVFRLAEWGPEEEALSQFLMRHYAGVRTLPDQVFVEEGVEVESFSAWLRERAGRPIEARVPQRGRHAQMLALARENAREELAKVDRSVEKEQALERLAADLGLAHPPRRIEGFDIAHLEGQDTLASMVSFVDGRPDRKGYRIYGIRSLNGKVDDFEAMRETVARRYSRVVNDGLERPDLVLIDGGKGQLSAAKGVLDGLGLEAIPVLGLAKKKEEVFLPGREDPVLLPEASPGLLVLQAVRNEAHRFATTRHKARRAKRVTLSLLEGVVGVGRVRSRRLMEVFGSVEKILESTPEEIGAKTGLPRETAARLLVKLASRYSRSATGDEEPVGPRGST